MPLAHVREGCPRCHNGTREMGFFVEAQGRSVREGVGGSVAGKGRGFAPRRGGHLREGRGGSEVPILPGTCMAMLAPEGTL